MACLGGNKLSLTGEYSSRRKEEDVAVEISWEMIGRDLNTSQEAGEDAVSATINTDHTQCFKNPNTQRTTHCSEKQSSPHHQSLAGVILEPFSSRVG